MSAERSSNFWVQEELRLGTFEGNLVREVVAISQKNYGGDDMEGKTEKLFGNRLVLAGPMRDGYLKEIRSAMLRKLARSKLTGLAPPVTMYIPWGVMKLIGGLCACYGSDVKPVEGKKKGKGKLLLFVENIETANKLFDPTRFDGTNFLVKRVFRKTNTRRYVLNMHMILNIYE